MKKILLTLILLILFIPGVKADDSYTTYEAMYQDYIPFSNFTFDNSNVSTSGYIYNNFDEFYKDSKNKEVFNTLYLDIIDAYTSNFKEDYPLYRVSVFIKSTSSSEFKLNQVSLNLYMYSNINDEAVFSIRNSYILGEYYPLTWFRKNDLNYGTEHEIYQKYFSGTGTGTSFGIRYYPFSRNTEYYVNFAKYNQFNSVPFKNNDNGTFYLPTLSFESSQDKVITGTTDVWKIYDSNSELIGTYEAGDVYPILYLPGEIKSYYTHIDLDNYEYVILSLKDYSNNEAFYSTLKVKGMVGITPVYEFGTIEKNEVTDRCNSSYSELTDYNLYILSADLINNAVYYVKACEAGSEFEFDNTVFDITYVTTENVDDPVVTVGGVDYNVIPFDKLGTTANSNEENNFVPGANQQFNPFDSIADYISSFWNLLSTFMGLVTKFFNTLPIEIRAISITMFTTACTLGLLKIIKS